MPGLTRTWSSPTMAPYFPSVSASHTPPTSILFQTAVCSLTLHAVYALLSRSLSSNNVADQTDMQLEWQALVVIDHTVLLTGVERFGLGRPICQAHGRPMLQTARDPLPVLLTSRLFVGPVTAVGPTMCSCCYPQQPLMAAKHDHTPNNMPPT